MNKLLAARERLVCRPPKEKSNSSGIIAPSITDDKVIRAKVESVGTDVPTLYRDSIVYFKREDAVRIGDAYIVKIDDLLAQEEEGPFE